MKVGADDFIQGGGDFAGAPRVEPGPLAALHGLPANPSLEEIEKRLRAMAAGLNGTDRLGRAVLRERATQLLKSLGVPRALELVEAALGLSSGVGALEHQGKALLLADPEPWPESVNPTDLARQLRALFEEFLILPAGAPVFLTLWVLHAHAHDAAQVSPLCALVSPTKRCGKTRVLTLIGAVVPRPLTFANITVASLFRTTEKYKPTLLIDEADTWLRSDAADALRGMLNSGHIRSGAVAVRCEGEDREPRQFSTWAPKVTACIGRLPDTLEDRAIVVPMRRKGPGEKVKAFRVDRLQALDPLRRKAWRWASDNRPALGQAEPPMPEELDDRAQDNWSPLLAIADRLGGEWPAWARDAARLLSGPDRRQDDTASTQLLADIQRIFDERRVDRLASEVIAGDLARLEDRPWPEWGRSAKPITPRQIAKLLGPFEIRPKTIRVGDHTLRGYHLEDFADAFSRYLPGPGSEPVPDPQQPQHTRAGAGLADTIDPQQHGEVADQRSNQTGRNYADVAAVADQSPTRPGEHVYEF